MRIRQWRCPIFIQKSGRVLRFVPIAYWQGFMLVYMVHANMLMLRRARAPQSIKHVDACHIRGETNVTSCHRSRQSHRDDCAHNVVWICTSGSGHEHIPIPQGQKHSWLWKDRSPNHEEPSYKVHDHPQTGIYIYTYIYTHTHIHTTCTMLTCKAGK